LKTAAYRSNRCAQDSSTWRLTGFAAAVRGNRKGLCRLYAIACAIALMCMAGPAAECQASWNLSLDADVRGRIASGTDPDATLNLFGAALRKTFADSKGDRLVLFALFESEKEFGESRDESLHEIYVQYKGPMGLWNITVGRFGLPWGLLPDFSTSRLLYDMPHDRVLGMDVDSGIKISGVQGMVDYGLSYSRGYGPRNTVDAGSHGIAMGRIGITPGETEEFSLGLSGAWGRSINAHGGDHGDSKPLPVMPGQPVKTRDDDRALQRAVVGLDSTLYLGRWLIRSEVSGGQVDKRAIRAFFAGADYALRSNLDLNLAVNLSRHDSKNMNEWFAGLTCRLPWFIVRGGYRYVGYGEARNQITIQFYRLFSYIW
jgi:hypothetical protein